MSDDVRHLIARRIREEMERQGKRQWQLSAALELDQSSTTLRVQGRRSFRAEELVRVARWLQVPIASLFADVEEIPAASVLPTMTAEAVGRQ